MIRRLTTQSPRFDAELKALLALEAEQDAGIERTVVEILADIRQHGDAALLETTRKFDRLEVLRWKLPPNGFVHFMSVSGSRAGRTPRPTAQCWASALRRWIASVSMCRVARRPIHLRC